MSARELEPENDPLVNLIKRQEKLSSTSLVPSIFKMHHQVGGVHPHAYTPRLISIGPYHHDNPYLQAMEIQKFRCFDTLRKRDEEALKNCYSTFLKEERRIRDCYAEKVDMSPEELVDMMLLDGCFVVEHIHEWKKHDDKQKKREPKDDQDDDLSKQNLNHTVVAHDMLLLENQLPFFVLNQLFLETRDAEMEQDSFANMALRFFSTIKPGPGFVCSADNSVEEPSFKHLLDLVYANCCPANPSVERCELPRTVKFMRSATKLKELGIKFKALEADILPEKETVKKDKLFKVKFDKRKGIMYIPTLTINQDTERLFRNLIAYEQVNQGCPSIIMDYTRLMDYLINTESDVAFLSTHGIIDNWLGSDQRVAKTFNELNNYVYLSTDNCYYSGLFNDVYEYYNGCWNQLKLSLRCCCDICLRSLAQLYGS